MSARPSDPRIALSALTQVRRVIYGVQAVLIAADGLSGHFHGHHYVAAAVVAVLVIGDVLRSRVPAEPRSLEIAVWAHVLLDTVALAAISFSEDHAHAPLEAFVLVELAIASAALTANRAWTLAGVVLAITLGSTAVSHGAEVEHGLGHAGAVLAIVWFGTRLARAQREQEEQLREAEADRERTARLASIGTMAAGVAHELGTPLGSIELLAEEAAARLPAQDPGHDVLATLQGQVRRCRGIVDRLVARGEASDGTTSDVRAYVARWVSDWRAAQPDPLAVRLAELPDTAVRGDPTGWRAALWTILDNAARAGAREVQLSGVIADGALHLDVEDDGHGLLDGARERIFEPFWSGWNESGAGLGLYTARRFARSAGGDVRIGLGRAGARVTLSMEVA